MKLRLVTFAAAAVLAIGIPHFTRPASAQTGGGVGLGLAEAQGGGYAWTPPREVGPRPRPIVRSHPSRHR